MFTFQGFDLDHAARQVRFNSDQLASSTIANDYSDFVRTLAYNDYSLDSTPTSWVHQQSATTGLHEECTTTRWRLLRLFVAPTS
jgi:hypothetical protein